MTDTDVYVCGHCGKRMTRGVDEILYACYRLETRNIHCAYLCGECFGSLKLVSWTENLDE
jgi:hypothetical protein